MKFRVIVADNPWEFFNKNTGGSFKSGASAKYNTISLQELIDLPVKKIVERNALLFLWVPTALSHEVARSGLVESWGFNKVVTKIYWIKIGSLGLGFNFRNQIEECWVCRRGSVKSFRTAFPNVIMSGEPFDGSGCAPEFVDMMKPIIIISRSIKHSQKPEEFWQMIQPSIDKFGLYPCLEMFSRERRPTWMAIGNEISGNDIRVDLDNLIKENLLTCYYYE